MSSPKILHILTILILLNINTALSERSEVDAGSSGPDKTFLQILANNCFLIKNETSENTGDIAEDLNGKLDARLFISTTTGLRVDTKTFANLLTDCLTTQANVNVNIPTEGLRNNVQMLANLVFDNREIPYEQVKDLMHSKRSKRSTENNPQNIIQQLLLDLIITPLKTGVNALLDNAGNIIKSFGTSSESVNNPVQNLVQEATNGVINTILSLIDSVKTNVNSLLDSFVTPINGNQTVENTPKALVRTQTNNIFFDIMESTLVGPIRSTFNRIIVSLNSTIYSFYTTTPTDNPIQSALNGIINEIVMNCMPVINKIHAVVNGVLNQISNGNITV
ncbi:unnamed protein product [Phyllotreta striolata]|uniref:Uncharacterized protein n=1 Tax=Phyllotreta striolata TaxID=444603 RepID=A0A9N9XNL7_PHYSR|nr:unnamed protein product [Phyllotreta striolata]